jgi:hypothetical protein
LQQVVGRVIIPVSQLLDLSRDRGRAINYVTLSFAARAGRNTARLLVNGLAEGATQIIDPRNSEIVLPITRTRNRIGIDIHTLQIELAGQGLLMGVGAQLQREGMGGGAGAPRVIPVNRNFVGLNLLDLNELVTGRPGPGNEIGRVSRVTIVASSSDYQSSIQALKDRLAVGSAQTVGTQLRAMTFVIISGVGGGVMERIGRIELELRGRIFVQSVSIETQGQMRVPPPPHNQGRPAGAPRGPFGDQDSYYEDKIEGGILR